MPNNTLASITLNTKENCICEVNERANLALIYNSLKVVHNIFPAWF